MERFKVNEDTMEVIDTFKSNPNLIDYIGQDLLLEIGVLKEMVLGPSSKIATNLEFIKNCLKKLETIRLSNATYVINSDLYDSELVKFLGSKALNRASIPKKILKTIKK